MTDHSDRTRDDGRIWGHVEDGIFWAVPKSPLINGGWGPPPFSITLPDGRVRRIVHKPDDVA